MIVTRMDLDGSGKGSPEGLVSAILAIEKDLPIPVPIEELCHQLDISEIAGLQTDAFEGSLLTDTTRSLGIILVNQSRPRQRQRFSIGHELAHFLIPTHMPDKDGRFLCSRNDMKVLSAKENDRRGRMEVEANRFSSLILIPPPMFRKDLQKLREPDLRHMLSLADRYDVSKEAMARAYANYHSQKIAIVICKDGLIKRIYKLLSSFPYIVPSIGGPVPAKSLFNRTNKVDGRVTELEGCLPDLWLNVERGRAAPTLSEQVLYQRDGFAMILLYLESRDEDEEVEEELLQRRWHVGFR